MKNDNFRDIVKDWKRVLEMDDDGPTNQSEMREELEIVRPVDARFAELAEKMLDDADALAAYIRARERG